MPKYSQAAMSKLTQQIKAWGMDLGFQQVGISDTDLSHIEEQYQTWIDDKKYGDMDYMHKHGSKRLRPHELIEGTLRVISVRMDHLPHHQDFAIKQLDDGTTGYISRYALGRDYHKVLRKRLKKLAQRIEKEIEDSFSIQPIHADNHHSGQVDGKVDGTVDCALETEVVTETSMNTSDTHASGAHAFEYRVFVDSAPVMEKPIAQKAGLGWQGKHTNLINSKAGSWFFLGELYTNLPLELDAPATDHCGSCTACIDVCPTQAITGPYQLDARRCISYLTIEHKGSIPEEFRTAIGNRIYGCDDCQLFCPWNKFADLTDEKDFMPRHKLDNSTLLELFSWTEEDFLKNTEGSAIRRIGYARWMRNIAIALGNSHSNHQTVIEHLQLKLNHSTEVIHESIVWAIQAQKAYL